MKLIAILLVATAGFAFGQKYGRGSDTGADFLVQRARMVLADPGRWAPEHVARARQILAAHEARLEAERRETERRLAERERAFRAHREQEQDRRLDDLEREAAMRDGRSWFKR